MSVTFNCPHCGAQLEYQGREPALDCPYCGSSTTLPAELQQVQAQAEMRKMLSWPELRRNRWFQIGALLFFVIFILPTCIGLVGSLMGIVVGVGAPFAALVLQFLAGR